MVMALSAGGYFAGVFHLTTHAGFKSLLFLCSGIFIHEFHTNDMRIIGKQGGRRLKIPMVCIAVGALALSGVFPFSGFFSKEAILGVLAAQPNKIWLAAGLFGAVLTAYYSFRLIFFILFPKGGIEEKHHDEHADSSHEHEGEHHGYIFWAMAIPVMVLACVTLVLGFVEHPIEHFLLGMQFRPTLSSMSPNTEAGPTGSSLWGFPPVFSASLWHGLNTEEKGPAATASSVISPRYGNCSTIDGSWTSSTEKVSTGLSTAALQAFSPKTTAAS